MTAAAVLFVGYGAALLVLPAELLAAVGIGTDRGTATVAQCLGAALIGLGVVNWVARRLLIGGPYGRPIATGNFVHAAIGFLVMLRAVMDGVGGSAVMLHAAVWALVAGAFGLLLFANPLRSNRAGRGAESTAEGG
jgi:hypothetical protein